MIRIVIIHMNVSPVRSSTPGENKHYTQKGKISKQIGYMVKLYRVEILASPIMHLFDKNAISV